MCQGKQSLEMGGEKESNKDSRERERENSGRIREFLQDPAYSCNVLFLYFYQASVIVSASLSLYF